MTWIHGHYRGTHAFRYKKGSTQTSLVSLAQEKPLLSCFPNPFTPFVNISVARSFSTAQIDIYNINGTLVRTFDNLKAPGTLIWDGNNSSGRSIGAGKYIIKLTADEKTFRQHVTILR